ncbi:MAG: histidine--tRNA ligase [Acidobacteriota bacterium]|nr:histidine--tRNA ligase [Acidobacteriota bacterium]
MSKTQPARGMRDFLPSDVRKRNYVIGIIREVYESYGFEPLETPAVENLETLVGKYGEEGNQLIFKILKRGEKLDVNGKELADLALRYDLTVPLARVVANYRNELPKFFKRYQIQPVWRADRPARGRFREFYQCDVDAIGSSSMIVEAELCAAGNKILTKLGFDDFIIRVNHREILYAMLDAVEIIEEKQTDVLVALDKLDKIGSEGVLKEFETRGIDKDAANKLLELFNQLKDENNAQILSSLAEFVGNHERGKQAINQISQIIELMDLKSLKIDASLARGLSYYTGAIFEVNVPDLAGSIASGGRYDGLIGMFGKEQIPACGFSLGLERILVVMEERGMFQKLVDEGKLKLDSADVMIASFDESLIDKCLKLADDLRKAGLRTLVYPEANQKIKPLKYAEQIGVPFVCLVKEAEIAENKMTLINMRTREQEPIDREKIAEKIKS